MSFQKLWIQEIGWDIRLLNNVKSEWNDWIDSLSELQDINARRNALKRRNHEMIDTNSPTINLFQELSSIHHVKKKKKRPRLPKLKMSCSSKEEVHVGFG
ncbi:hypothetical protein HPB48_015739 [Haemaphysalis longicornis]|uniref:Uncharacterized protein n=1 Tax=Haemaphysalis longicornis TaxID=44386 RepID=A0A9J6GVW8_HAELO|nr:hypothetical protein HPB48_015739 [Haemaphysalis longicornis]